MPTLGECQMQTLAGCQMQSLGDYVMLTLAYCAMQSLVYCVSQSLADRHYSYLSKKRRWPRSAHARLELSQAHLYNRG